MSTVTPNLSALDTAPVPDGANEELAGPVHVTPRPVAANERISSMDVLRGFSLMGILLMNITSFALPEWNYMFPLMTIKPVSRRLYWRQESEISDLEEDTGRTATTA
jgi:uncharacterized protein